MDSTMQINVDKITLTNSKDIKTFARVFDIGPIVDSLIIAVRTDHLTVDEISELSECIANKKILELKEAIITCFKDTLTSQ